MLRKWTTYFNNVFQVSKARPKAYKHPTSLHQQTTDGIQGGGGGGGW